MSAEIDYSKVGMRIRVARKERKMTQEEVAQACGCSNNHLSAVEGGINKPSLELVIRLATVLDSSAELPDRHKRRLGALRLFLFTFRRR